MPLFEVAVIEEPTKKAMEEDGAMEKLILAPTYVMARDVQSAAIKVLRDSKIDANLDRCKVLIRPFV